MKKIIYAIKNSRKIIFVNYFSIFMVSFILYIIYVVVRTTPNVLTEVYKSISSSQLITAVLFLLFIIYFCLLYPFTILWIRQLPLYQKIFHRQLFLKEWFNIYINTPTHYLSEKSIVHDNYSHSDGYKIYYNRTWEKKTEQHFNFPFLSSIISYCFLRLLYILISFILNIITFFIITPLFGIFLINKLFESGNINLVLKKKFYITKFPNYFEDKVKIEKKKEWFSFFIPIFIVVIVFGAQIKSTDKYLVDSYNKTQNLNTQKLLFFQNLKKYKENKPYNNISKNNSDYYTMNDVKKNNIKILSVRNTNDYLSAIKKDKTNGVSYDLYIFIGNPKNEESGKLFPKFALESNYFAREKFKKFYYIDSNLHPNFDYHDLNGNVQNTNNVSAVILLDSRFGSSVNSGGNENTSLFMEHKVEVSN